VDFFVSAFVTLAVVVDPLGLAAIFLAATQGATTPARHSIARRACLYAMLILFGAALFGERLLQFLGVSLPAFRIAGGLLLFTLASEMVLGVREVHDARTAEQALAEHHADIAAFPLATPLMAGPGAIAATLLLATRAGMDPTRIAALCAALIAVIAACFVTFRLATRVDQLVGRAGNLLFAKLLGVLLAALAVQFVVDGGRALLAG